MKYSCHVHGDDIECVEYSLHGKLIGRFCFECIVDDLKSRIPEVTEMKED